MIKFNLQKVLDIKLKQEINKQAKAEKKKEKVKLPKLPMPELTIKGRKVKTDKESESGLPGKDKV